MADNLRPLLRVLPGGACPPTLRPGLVRDMEREFLEVVTKLEKVAASARSDLNDEELHGAICSAVGGVHLARLALERWRVSCRG